MHVWKPEGMSETDVDPVLRWVELLLLFGAVVWVVLYLTDALDGLDLLVHEVLTAVLLLVFRRRRRADA